MVTKDDIRNYFDLEAETSRERWLQTMSLPVKERIRKRKAISPVFLDAEYTRNPENGNIFRKIHFSVNLSDFKEGDSLLLHKEGTTEGIGCLLWKFEGENEIVLDFYSVPAGIESYCNIPLVLDKNHIDLRPNVFDNFLYDLPTVPEYWERKIVNTKASPVFEDVEKNCEELEDTIKNFKLDLLPRQKEAILNSMSAKDYYLIQGPPGTGKSFILSIIILEETLYFDHKVAIIGPNHMAINNVIGQALRIMPFFYYRAVKIGQSFNAPNTIIPTDEGNLPIQNFPYIIAPLANSIDGPVLYGLTPYSLYTSRARELEFDTLVIDEAGQMTIPIALMGMIRAKKVILAGDHKQLPPIINSEGLNSSLKSSIFQALVTEENCTMLDVSFRMCEPICNFVSKLFYDNEVKPQKHKLENRLAERIRCTTIPRPWSSWTSKTRENRFPRKRPPQSSRSSVDSSKERSQPRTSAFWRLSVHKRPQSGDNCENGNSVLPEKI